MNKVQVQLTYSNMPDLFELRNDYHSDKLDEPYLPDIPFLLFEDWFNFAVAKQITDPNAMVLSTCGKNNQPSSRVVLLKYYDENGFTFFTNYNSRKGKEISVNPMASLLFFWPRLHKQIRIEGPARKSPEEISEKYFASRPDESKISAIISPQSEIVENRDYLEEKYNAYKKGQKILTRPQFWGGYTLKPVYFEFWQGRTGRLHDRVTYSLSDDKWVKNRLAP